VGDPSPRAVPPAGASRRALSPLPGDPDKRGPQHWYAEAHGPPAEHLPPDDVGPHLPPGGWRGSLPRGEDGAVLPQLPRTGRTVTSGANSSGLPMSPGHSAKVTLPP
jgi:hypothetical protein